MIESSSNLIYDPYFSEIEPPYERFFDRFLVNMPFCVGTVMTHEFRVFRPCHGQESNRQTADLARALSPSKSRRPRRHFTYAPEGTVHNVSIFGMAKKVGFRFRVPVSWLSLAERARLHSLDLTVILPVVQKIVCHATSRTFYCTPLCNKGLIGEGSKREEGLCVYWTLALRSHAPYIVVGGSG